MEKDLILDLAANYDQIQERISGMELHLLAALMKERSELLVKLNSCLAASVSPREAKREILKDVARQNGYIKARITEKAAERQTQLEQLNDRSRLRDAYGDGVSS